MIYLATDWKGRQFKFDSIEDVADFFHTTPAQVEHALTFKKRLGCTILIQKENE